MPRRALSEDERRQASCTGKERLTKAIADKIAKHTAHSLHPYRCRFCSYWHVGGNNTGKMKTDRRHIDDS